MKTMTQMTMDSSSKTMEVRRQWSDIFLSTKRKEPSTKTSISSKTKKKKKSFKMKAHKDILRRGKTENSSTADMLYKKY